jgi:hypothetical protein
MSAVVRNGGNICPHHDQLTVGEVNHVDHAKDYHQAQGCEQQEGDAVKVLVKQAYEIP